MVSPFALTASALIECGYSPLPIAPWGEHDWNPKGKEPGRLEVGRNGEPEWYRLKNWQLFCERQAHPKIVEYWAKWPDAGVGIATGFGGLVAIDIDDDALIDPILDVLPPLMVAKRGRKGLTAFVRTDEPLPSKNYRTTDKRGLLDFLSAGKQTVIPKTPHPAGGWYEWTTERTLLDTPLTELPALTREHVAAMEKVLRAYGWAAPERQPRGAAGERLGNNTMPSTWGNDDVNWAALANLPAWVPDLGLPKLRRNGTGYRAVAPWRASGSGRAAAARGAHLSIHPTGIVDFGSGDTFSAITIAAKAREISYDEARDWLRDKLGLSDAPLIHLRNGASSSAVVPSYSDQRVPLDEATARLQTLTGPDFANTILNGIAVRNQAALKPPLILPVHPVTSVRSEAGIGKTHAAREGTAKQARLGRRIAYVVPRHDLAEQIAADFASDGVKAEVYRGYERKDPLAQTSHVPQHPGL